MSRTVREPPSPGCEWWSRRPMSGHVYSFHRHPRHGRILKRLSHHIERQRAKRDISKEQ